MGNKFLCRYKFCLDLGGIGGKYQFGTCHFQKNCETTPTLQFRRQLAQEILDDKIR